MQDMNFFSQFNKKKNNNDSSIIILIGFVSAIALFVLVTLAYTSIGIYYNKYEATKYVDKLQSPAMQKKIQESTKVNNKISALTQYNNGITALNTLIDSREVVSTTLMNKISSTLPTDVTFTSLNISNTKIDMVGTSKSMPAIAELEHNLGKLSGVSSVYIPSIVPVDDNTYSFSVTCTMKGVD